MITSIFFRLLFGLAIAWLVTGLATADDLDDEYSDKSPKRGGEVIITPLGAEFGELCAMDRAMLFEDPSGIRILLQPGRTVSGSDDPRLGEVHVVLLDHAHGDHSGDQIGRIGN